MRVLHGGLNFTLLIVEVRTLDELIIPIVFEDENGERHVCTTSEEFDKAMEHDQWHLVFE